MSYRAEYTLSPRLVSILPPSEAPKMATTTMIKTANISAERSPRNTSAENNRIGQAEGSHMVKGGLHWHRDLLTGPQA